MEVPDLDHVREPRRAPAPRGAALPNSLRERFEADRALRAIAEHHASRAPASSVDVDRHARGDQGFEAPVRARFASSRFSFEDSHLPTIAKL